MIEFDISWLSRSQAQWALRLVLVKLPCRAWRVGQGQYVELRRRVSSWIDSSSGIWLFKYFSLRYKIRWVILFKINIFMTKIRQFSAHSWKPKENKYWTCCSMSIPKTFKIKPYPPSYLHYFSHSAAIAKICLTASSSSPPCCFNSAHCLFCR